MENQTEVPPLVCCSPKSKLICVSAFLVALVIVAAASFVLGRALPRGPEGTLRGTPTIIVLPTSIPTPDETADWKTYKNEALGFELQYPSSLEVVDNTTKMLNTYKESDKKCQEQGGGCGGGPRPSWTIDFLSASDQQKTATENPSFSIRPYQFNLSVYQGISLYILYGEKAPVGYEQTLTDQLIGGKMGLKNVQKDYLLYGVDNKGKTYSFMFLNRTDSAQDLEYTESILSTFKFLD